MKVFSGRETPAGLGEFPLAPVLTTFPRKCCAYFPSFIKEISSILNRPHHYIIDFSLSHAS